MTGPAPADPRDAPRAAWITAYAFTGKSRLQALHVIPGTREIRSAVLWLPLLPQTRSATRRGVLYLDDTRSCTVICQPAPDKGTPSRWQVIPLALGGLAVVAVMILAGILQGWPYVLPPVLVALVLVEPLLPHWVGGSAADTRPIPPGPRWQITGLASIDTTHETNAVLFAKTVANAHVRVGAVIVVSALTPRLYRAYRSFGFTPASNWPRTQLYRIHRPFAH